MAKTKRAKQAKRRTQPRRSAARRSGASRARRARPARRTKAARRARTRRPAGRKARKTVKTKKVRRTAKKVRRTARSRAAGTRTARRRAGARPARKTARRKPARRPSAPKPAARRAPAKAAGTRQTTPSAPAPAAAPSKRSRRSARASARPLLDRERRQLPEEERSALSSGRDDRMTAAARSGHDELRDRLVKHTEADPRLTGGDIDARWEDAYAVGDEAPGGDNPTPDQDRVDDIGRALGVSYQDNEELRSSDKIADRDRHRWEYDPASSEDWPHDKKS